MTTLAPLASTSDLQDRLGRTLTATESTRAAKLLSDASAAVRAYVRQDITRQITTQRFRQIAQPDLVGSIWWAGWVRLAQKPVNAVSAVVDIDGNVLVDGTDYRWVGGQRLMIAVPGYVDVTYDHGFDTTNDPRGVLDAVAGVVCQIVGRALGRPADETAMTSETVDGYSYTVGAAAAAGPFGMLDDEKCKLDDLLGRTRATSVRLG